MRALGRLALRRPSRLFPSLGAAHAAAAESQKPPQQGPLLVSATGAPLSSASTSSSLGAELELTPQNAAQVLQSASPFLMLVGDLQGPVAKKVGALRAAAQGRLPLLRLNCSTLPQICQALQITTSPTLLLMAKGQVVAVLEKDLSPAAATAFVENVGQMLGLKVALAEDVTEQLAEAEELEWTDASAADATFFQVLSSSDLPNDARVKALAGRVRCALRQRSEPQAVQARQNLSELQTAGQGSQPEVKQASAMLWIDEKQRELGDVDLQALKAKAEASPRDLATVQAYAVTVFWSKGGEVAAFDAALAVLRRDRSGEARQLVLSLVEALGPRHPKSTSARRSFSNALFV